MKLPLISIVIPTYQEAENITILVEQIDSVLKEAGFSYELVIVDDNSKDGIIEIVDNLKKSCQITLEVREKRNGLASAVIDGINMATGQVVVVMDADLSHPPTKIPELVIPILNDNYDLVIGSRYIKGGAVINFNIFRMFNAWASKLLAKPFIDVADPLSGFFAFSRKLIKPDLDLCPLGFKIGLELIVKAAPKKILEIPIEFSVRQCGKSKLTVRVQFQYILHIWRILKYKLKNA
jgi:dolichol-phosphate mannosyltransferase